MVHIFTLDNLCDAISTLASLGWGMLDRPSCRGLNTERLIAISLSVLSGD